MHIQKNMMHWYAWLVIATIIISILGSPLVAEASILTPTANPVTAGKLIDMCLTRSGKVVNGDIREDVLNQTRNVLNDTATSYRQWCEDNGKAKSVETFREYMESDAYASLPFRLSKFPLELASFINWLIEGETLLDVIGNDIEDVLTEHDEKGNVTVPSETVNIINQCFENVKGTYTSGWHYETVYASSELSTDLFGNPTSLANAKAYIDSSDNPTMLFVSALAGADSIYFYDNSCPLYYVKTISSSAQNNFADCSYYGNNGYKWTIYDNDWNTYIRYYKEQKGTTQFIVNDALTFSENSLTDAISPVTSMCTVPYCTYVNNYWWTDAPGMNAGYLYAFYGKQSGQVIVYDSLQAVKDYSLGNTPYYLTNRQYSDSVDNSFNVSGEYIQNNGGTFAYEQIREQINNSNVTNDSSVSNIVNDYSQTIINNYNYTSPDNGEDEGGSDNEEDGGNGLLDLLGGLGDLLDFIMSLLGQVISIIAGFLNALLDILRSLGGIFSGFSGLLGELFSFIPTELITLLTASIEAVILIAVWKMIKK